MYYLLSGAKGKDLTRSVVVALHMKVRRTALIVAENSWGNKKSDCKNYSELLKEEYVFFYQNFGGTINGEGGRNSEVFCT
jgi:hypothetical protein